MMHHYKKPFFFRFSLSLRHRATIISSNCSYMINTTQGNSTQLTPNKHNNEKMQSKFPKNVTTYSGKKPFGDIYRHCCTATIYCNNCTALCIAFLWRICSSNKGDTCWSAPKSLDLLTQFSAFSPVKATKVDRKE